MKYLIEEYYLEVQEGTRPVSDWQNAISAQTKLIDNLESISGLNRLLNINSAMAKVLQEGYQIIDKKPPQ